MTPVAVSGGLPFASVSAGSGHTCGVTPAGGAYCWGWNVYGQLGDGTTTDRPTPVAVSGGLTFASLSAGNVYNCGVTPAGAGYCWGWNKDGELGIGTTTGPQTCWTVVCSMTPVAVSGGLPFASVSAGGGHTCGVTPAGGGYCWGANGIGELGNGTTTTSPTPVAVSGGLIFAGVLATPSGRTCGVTPAGAAYCWGWNKDGELGIGTTTGPQTCGPVDPEVFVACSLTPAAVSGGLSFASVSARGDHTCGVTPAGAAYCWGLNLYGELGNGTAANSSVPVPVSQ
jgi:alpha-tubulin suppressor-like RCC1 family protein